MAKERLEDLRSSRTPESDPAFVNVKRDDRPSRLPPAIGASAIKRPEKLPPGHSFTRRKRNG
jgi:hypothetical protein